MDGRTPRFLEFEAMPSRLSMKHPMGAQGEEVGKGSVGPVIHSHRHNLRNRFELVKTLGEGTYGKVKLAVEKATNEKVVH